MVVPSIERNKTATEKNFRKHPELILFIFRGNNKMAFQSYVNSSRTSNFFHWCVTLQSELMRFRSSFLNIQNKQDYPHFILFHLFTFTRKQKRTQNLISVIACSNNYATSEFILVAYKIIFVRFLHANYCHCFLDVFFMKWMNSKTNSTVFLYRKHDLKNLKQNS